VSKWGYRAHRDGIAAGRFVRVVNFHQTPASQRDQLRSELSELSQAYTCVTAADLDQFYLTGTWSTDRPGVLPVFYEGYREHAEIAAPLLDEFGLTGWFFVCTGFLDCPVAEQRAFARSHRIDLARSDSSERVAMSWDDVAALSQGHVVTPHTASHDGIADVTTDEDIEREIFRPKRRLDAVTGQQAPAMAWLGGTPYGGSERHDEAVRDAGYRYVFSRTMIQRLD
jgi:peptidoglycan/xylan/chitin deacetylase (PgdA/CDA1 family)